MRLLLVVQSSSGVIPCSFFKRSSCGEWVRNLLNKSLLMMDLSARSLKARSYLSRGTSYMAKTSSLRSAGSFLKKLVLLSMVLTVPKPSVAKICMVSLKTAADGLAFPPKLRWARRVDTKGPLHRRMRLCLSQLSAGAVSESEETSCKT